MARRFVKVSEEKTKTAFFYPFDLVNTKTAIPLRVGEERWIYTSTLRVSVYIHYYLPPLRGIVVYYTDTDNDNGSDNSAIITIITTTIRITVMIMTTITTTISMTVTTMRVITTTMRITVAIMTLTMTTVETTVRIMRMITTTMT